MLEFAAGVPLIFLILSGCFQFGYYFYIYDRLETAVRAGARYASIRSYNSASATPAADFTAAVKNVVIYANPAGGTNTTAPGLTSANVNLAVTMKNNVPDQMYVSITGYQIDAIFAAFTLVDKPAARFRYSGRYAP